MKFRLVADPEAGPGLGESPRETGHSPVGITPIAKKRKSMRWFIALVRATMDRQCNRGLPEAWSASALPEFDKALVADARIVANSGVPRAAGFRVTGRVRESRAAPGDTLGSRPARLCTSRMSDEQLAAPGNGLPNRAPRFRCRVTSTQDHRAVSRSDNVAGRVGTASVPKRGEDSRGGTRAGALRESERRYPDRWSSLHRHRQRCRRA